MRVRSRFLTMHLITWCFVFVATMDLASQDRTEPPEGLRAYAPSVFALTGAKLVTAPGRVIENGVVIVRDEKIVAVGESGEVEIPLDAQRIDLTGKTVYAGFIDAYSDQSVEIESLELGSPYWNSHVRPQLHVVNQLELDESENEKYRSQGVVARLIAPDGGIIKGTSVVAMTSDDEPAQAIVNDAAALHMLLTVSRRFGSSDGPSYPNSPMGAVALARQAFLDAIWYRDANSAVAADSRLSRPSRNDALEELQTYLDGDQLVVFDSLNELYTLRADRFAKEFSLRAAIRASGYEYRRLDAVRAAGRPMIVPLNFPQPPNVGSEEAASAVSLESLMHWDHAPENPGRLANAGIEISLTSTGLESQSDFLDAVRTAVARGLSQADALAALTVNPASLLNVDHDLGTIEAGKIACLVVSDGNIFEADSEITETWVRGIRYSHVEPSRESYAGTWAAELEYQVGKPNALVFELEHDSGSNKGTVAASSDSNAISIELNEVSVVSSQIQGSFESGTFGIEGMTRFAAIVQSDGDDLIAIGNVVWADGSHSPMRLAYSASSQSEDDNDSDSSSENDAVAAQMSSHPVNYPLGAFGVSTPSQSSHRVLFTNATVWTCAEDGIVESCDVLIGDGRIIAIGQDLSVDGEHQVIDATGMHLTPGIIDCHSHMASDSGINESGQAITAEVRIGDFIDCDDITIYRQLAGGVTASNILHGSANPIGGQNQVIKLRWGMLDEEMKMHEAPQGIKFALGENVTRASRDSVGERYPSTRMGVEQLFIDEFNAAIEYQQAWDDWNAQPAGLPPRRDLELEAIAELVSGDRWIHCHSYRQDEILALIRVLDHYEITIGTFQHILEGYKVAEEMAEHGAMASAFSDWWAYKMEVKDAIPFAGALMHEQGIVVSFNSDDGELGRHLNHEAAKAVKYGGVSPEEALKFVTLNPAIQLRIDQYVGSIEVGKHADIVLWNGSPLSTMSRCEQTWVDGIRYFDREDDQHRQEELANRRNDLIQKILWSGQEMRAVGVEDEDPSRLWPREDIFCKHGHDHVHDELHEEWEDHFFGSHHEH